jgi:hypothetical protein
MIVVFTEYGENYRGIVDVTLPVMKKYCNKHGYAFIELVLGNGNDYAYKKHKEFGKLFYHANEIEAIFYLDADCLITNLNHRVEDFLDNEHDYFLTKDFNELNNGVCIIRNTEAGRFINDTILSGEGYYENEQNAINDFMKDPRFNRHVKVLPHPSINSYRYDLYPECASCVGVEDLGDWRPGHFILHTPGLAIEKRIEILKNATITK